jgi:hypothetical protein
MPQDCTVASSGSPSGRTSGLGQTRTSVNLCPKSGVTPAADLIGSNGADASASRLMQNNRLGRMAR